MITTRVLAFIRRSPGRSAGSSLVTPFAVLGSVNVIPDLQQRLDEMNLVERFGRLGVPSSLPRGYVRWHRRVLSAAPSPAALVGELNNFWCPSSRNCLKIG
jgi:hypothetical protein